MGTRYPTVPYVRRRPPLSSLDHFATLIEEANAPYVALFHDDDVMMDNFAATLREALARHPGASAVAGDAFVIFGEHRTTKRVMRQRKDRMVVDSKEFLQPYLSLGPDKPPPFPGYLYRLAAIKGLALVSAEGGKYADVSFLLKVLERGPILWLAKPLLWYRLHASNDGGTEVVAHRLRLLRFLFSKGKIERRSAAITEYRLQYWIQWWFKIAHYGLLTPLSRPRDRVVRRFIFQTTCKVAFTRIAPWHKLVAKLWKV